MEYWSSVERNVFHCDRAICTSLNWRLLFSMFRINADTASYTCCFGLSVKYHKLLQKEKVSHSPLAYCFCFFSFLFFKYTVEFNNQWTVWKTQRLCKRPRRKVIKMMSFLPALGRLNSVEVAAGTHFLSAFLCSGFHAYFRFLKINAPGKSYS